MKSSSFNLFQVQENMTPVLAGRNYGICILMLSHQVCLQSIKILMSVPEFVF